jgi:drug/metabolite transporter (DMT)-like permease
MSRRGWLLFWAMGVIWGFPYMLIKIAVRDVDPAALVLARTLIGTLVLLPVALARNEIRPVLRRWRPLLAFTLVEICVPWLFLSDAERKLPSSVTGLLIAAVPLVGIALARLSGNRERVSPRNAFGLAVGLCGVGLLVGFDLSGDLLSVGEVAIVVVAYAFGPAILSRYLSDLPSMGVVASSLALSAVLYLPFGLASLPSRWPSAEGTGAILGLGLGCTALAFIVFFNLIAEIGPVRSTVITYVNPAVALVLGVAFLGESFTLATGVGFVLVLGGSFFATSRPTDKRAMAPSGARAGSPPEGTPLDAVAEPSPTC